MRLLRLPSLTVASLVFCCAALSAQSAKVAPRITAAVDESSLVKLGGNVPLLARAEFDQGIAPAATQMTHVRMVLSRSASQQAGLDAFEAELQNPASANYHKWLTPDQFGKLYGPADADIATIVSWLQARGLTVEEVSPGRTNIAFSGSVSMIEAAFHTSIHSFSTNGEAFLSNTTDPQIPAALATVVRGVAHLNTIHPRSHAMRGETGVFNPQTKRVERMSAAQSSGVHPDLTSGSDFLYIVAGDAATIYDTPNSYNANFSSGTSYTGAGVNIGVGSDTLIKTATVVDYRSRFLGNTTAPTIVNVDGVKYDSSNGDLDEAYLDTELAGALAPGATVYFYTSTDLVSGIEKAISDDIVNIFSLSFGQCELGLSTADNAQINGWWEQAAAEGIAVTVSSGDSGSAGCDDPNSETVATYGLQVSGFASTPYNIAVGGTDLYALRNSYSAYASTSEGSSSTYYRTALSYIPEAAWNNSSYYDSTISNDIPWSAVSGYSSYASIWAGSGGASNCSTNTSVDLSNGSVKAGTCTSGYSKPSWQRGTGVPSDGVRDIPDVSLMAGNGFFDGATWLICTDDTGTSSSSGLSITTNCATQSDGYFYSSGSGGTSTSAPAFAGILALVEQKSGSRLGQAAKGLYDLYNGSHAGSVFHDVTVGNIAVPCSSSSTNCVKDSSGYYFESGYNTTTGYDLATGLGSVDATQLINYWGTATATGTYSLAATSPSSITHGASTSSTVTVTSSTFAGTVTFSCWVTSTTASNPIDTPVCTAASTASVAAGKTATATLNITTTAATSKLVLPNSIDRSHGWMGLGGAALALLVFWGVPTRRRAWRNLMGVLIVLVTLGSLSGCGGSGGSSSSSSTTSSSSGTTAGTYTFLVTGTGNDASGTQATTSFSLTIN